MAKGAAPGERRGGRQKGTLNRITADIKALAQVHAPSAITKLAMIMATSENDQACIAAAKELLDRGYGKSVQGVEVSGVDGGPIMYAVSPIDEAL